MERQRQGLVKRLGERARASHPIDCLVALRHLVPVDAVDELPDVLLAPGVVLRERMVRHVADDERVGADPDAAVESAEIASTITNEGSTNAAPTTVAPVAPPRTHPR